MSKERKIIFNAKYLAILFEFKAAQDIRYYLNGFKVEPHPDQGVLLTATDGHRLVTVHDKDGSSNGQYICKVTKEMITGAQLNKNPMRAAGRRTKSALPMDAWACFIGDCFKIQWDSHGNDPKELIKKLKPAPDSLTTYAAHSEEIDGTFPDIQRVMPTETSFVLPDNGMAVNPAYLTATKLLSKITEHGQRFCDVQIFLTGDKNPIMIRSAAAPNVMILIMPLRPAEVLKPVADWWPEKPSHYLSGWKMAFSAKTSKLLKNQHLVVRSYERGSKDELACGQVFKGTTSLDKNVKANKCTKCQAWLKRFEGAKA